MSKKKITKIIGALVVIGIIIGGGYAINHRNSHKVSKDLELTLSNTPETMNPFYVSSSNALFVSDMLYEPIYNLNNDGSINCDGLAKKIVHTKDKKTYTVTLYKDLKWSDGQPVTANDLIYSFNEMMNPKNNIKLREKFLINNEPIKIKKINDLTVQFDLPEPSKDFIGNLALFHPIPEHIYKGVIDLKNSPENNKHVTDGPYMFQSEEKGKDLILVRNPYYEKNHSKVEKITFNIEPETNSGIVNFMAFNLNNKALSNIKVREAISYALNRKDLSQSKYENSRYIQDAYSIFTPSTEYYNNNVVEYNHDLDKAKELMKESGEHDLTLKLTYEAGAKAAGSEALVVKNNLAKIGINVMLQPLAENEFNKEVSNPKSGEYDLAITSYNEGTNPNNYAQLVITNGAKNISGFNNIEVDRLFKDAENTKNKVEKEKLYRQIQEIIAREIPIYTINYQQNIESICKDVLKVGMSGIVM